MINDRGYSRLADPVLFCYHALFLAIRIQRPNIPHILGRKPRQRVFGAPQSVLRSFRLTTFLDLVFVIDRARPSKQMFRIPATTVIAAM
jgi:hypothetical protein